MRKLTTEEFIQKVKHIHGDKYNYSKVEYIGSNIKVIIICPIHGEFKQLPNNHLYYGCNKCGYLSQIIKQSSNKEEFIKKANHVHSNKYDYFKVIYKNSMTKVCIICPKHGDFWQRPNDHLHNHGCPNCYNNHLKNTDQFTKDANIIHEYKYDYSKTNYINSKTKVCIICPKHGDFWQKPNCHLNGAGCPKCVGLNKTNNDFIKEAILIHGNFYDYSKVKYNNSKNIITIICPEHGEFKQKPNNHLQGQGCPRCNSFKGEILIEQWLKENNIKYIRQYKFDDCKNVRCLPFDFYIPDYNMCIEFDGRQHFEPVCFGGISLERAINNFKDTRKKDKIKNKYCKDNTIFLLRISYLNINDISNIIKFYLKPTSENLFRF